MTITRASVQRAIDERDSFEKAMAEFVSVNMDVLATELDEVEESTMADFITGMMQWCYARDIDVERAIRTARMNFENEKEFLEGAS